MSFINQNSLTAIAAGLQIIGAAALLELFTVVFNGAYAFVDCNEEVTALKADIEPGRLAGEEDKELGALPQWWKIQALNDFVERRIYG